MSPTSSPDRIRRLRELFDGAMDLPTAQRRTWLDRETHGDEALRAELEALITISETAEARLDGGAAQFIDAESAHPSLEGQRLGAYQVARCVGVGGMGAVYEAVRADDQYQHVQPDRRDGHPARRAYRHDLAHH